MENYTDVLKVNNLDLGEYDFVDFGCSNGKSLDFCALTFGGNGVGIDIDSNKVLTAKRNIINSVTGNHQVVQGDITKLDTKILENTVKFTSCIHFLEHVDGYNTVKNILQNAINISTDFIFIMQPFFDKNAELFEKGFKVAYSDWNGHSNLLTSYDFFRLCNFSPSIKDFIIFARIPILDSTDKKILPLDAPIDSHEYDLKYHSKKEFCTFENLFSEIGVFILLKDDVPVDKYLDKLYKKYGGEKRIIYDSRKII